MPSTQYSHPHILNEFFFVLFFMQDSLESGWHLQLGVQREAGVQEHVCFQKKIKFFVFIKI
jgi:hypothetical protein